MEENYEKVLTGTAVALLVTLSVGESIGKVWNL